MVKLVFVDMDGTFLTSANVITPRNARILDAAAERGVQFVPCSGRNINSLPEELLRHPSVRYAICCNGALITDAKTREVLHEVPIPKADLARLYSAIRDLPVTFDLFADSRVYTERSRFGYIDEVDLQPANRVVIKAARTLYDGDAYGLIERVEAPCRVNIFFHNEAERDACHAAIDANPSLRRSSSLPCNIEVTHVSAHKGAGVEWLCSHLGVDLADTVGFGDNHNDITMLQTAGDGVAMANATPECLAAADHTTASCEDSGVARYLEPLFA